MLNVALDLAPRQAHHSKGAKAEQTRTPFAHRAAVQVRADRALIVRMRRAVAQTMPKKSTKNQRKIFWAQILHFLVFGERSFPVLKIATSCAQKNLSQALLGHFFCTKLRQKNRPRKAALTHFLHPVSP